MDAALFLEKFKELINQHKNIIIFHHINPDGDCLGSQMGLKHILKIAYPEKNIYAIGDSKGLFPFLNIEHDTIPADIDWEMTLGIIVDANYLNRIQDSNKILVNKLKNIVRIDHHNENDDLNAILRWVDSSYSASAEQVTFIAKELKWEINEQIAEFLYLGIYTDSGRFLYPKTSSRTHRLVAYLMDTGVNVYKINLELSSRDLQDIKYMTYVYSKMKFYDSKIIHFFITQKTMHKLGISEEQANRVNLLANIQDFFIWVFFTEQKDGSIKISFRSTKYNVQSIAQKYGGGGHKLAAGAVLKTKTQIKNVLADLALLAN